MVIPGSVQSALKKFGVDFDKVCCAAKSDITEQGELKNTYLLLTDSSLVLAVSDYSGTMNFSSFTRFSEGKLSEGISDVYEYPLSRLSQPKVLNQVAGGLFVMDIDGVERWVCRFSSSRAREMHRFCRALDCKINGRELPPEPPG